MKKNAYLVNILLAAELFVLCLTAVIIRTYTPSAIFPRFDIPFFVLLSVIPFTAEYYLSPSRQHDPIVTILLAGLTFCLLPYAAGIDPEMSAWMLFTVSSAVFGTTMMLYSSIVSRMSSGPRSAFSPAVNALCLYLASQCFQGLI